jgi:hypothetical protein
MAGRRLGGCARFSASLSKNAARSLSSRSFTLSCPKGPDGGGGDDDDDDGDDDGDGAGPGGSTALSSDAESSSESEVSEPTTSPVSSAAGTKQKLPWRWHQRYAGDLTVAAKPEEAHLP